MKLLLPAVLIAVVSGCEVVDSDAVSTGGVYADYRVTAAGDGSSRVWAKLKVGGPLGTNLELAPDESLTAEADGRRLAMIRIDDVLGGVAYITGFATETPGTVFSIDYQRVDDISAPHSQVTLPQPLSLQLPTLHQAFGYNDDIDISWNPSGISPSVEFNFDTHCPSLSGGSVISSRSRIAADTGSYTINAYDIVGSLQAHVAPGASCTVEVRVERSNHGSVDAGFGEGGRFIATQQRERDVFISF